MLSTAQSQTFKKKIPWHTSLSLMILLLICMLFHLLFGEYFYFFLLFWGENFSSYLFSKSITWSSHKLMFFFFFLSFIINNSKCYVVFKLGEFYFLLFSDEYYHKPLSSEKYIRTPCFIDTLISSLTLLLFLTPNQERRR